MPILANYSLVKSNLNGYRANEGSQHFNSHSMVSQLLAIYRRIRWSNKKEGGGGGVEHRSNIESISPKYPVFHRKHQFSRNRGNQVVLRCSSYKLEII